MEPLLILALLFWGAGYIATTFAMSKAGMVSANEERIISPPKWLYYLCGAPVAKGYPRGTMRVYVFRVQMLGLMFGLNIALVKLLKPSSLEFQIVLLLSTILVLGATYYVSKHYNVSDRALKKKKIK